MSPKPQIQHTNEIKSAESRFNFKCEEAGASLKHNQITRNVSGLFWQYFRNQKCGCEPFTSDMPIYSCTKGGIYFPDVVVICEEPRFIEYENEIVIKKTGETKRITRSALINPFLIGEVWSESNKNPEKRTKLKHYEQIESLKEYLTFEQTHCEVCHYTKNTDGKWSEPIIIREESELLSFNELSFKLNLKDIYEKVL